MEFKGLLFAGIAFVVCLIFLSLGGYWMYTANDKIEQSQKQIDKFEKEDGEFHPFFEINQNDTEYQKAKKGMEDGKSSKSFSYVFFTIGAICLLIALTLVAIHFIMERNADKKMADTFFVDGKPPPRK